MLQRYHHLFLAGVLLDTNDANANPRRSLHHFNSLAKRRSEERKLLFNILQGRMESLGEIAMEIAINSGDPIGQVMAEVLENEPNPQLASQLVDKIPYPTTALRELAAVTER